MSWKRRLSLPGPERYWHVDGRDVQRRVEAVAGQVAGVEHGADGEVELADGEGAAAGLEVAAGVDAIGCGDAVAGAGVEAKAVPLAVEQAAAADDDLGGGVVGCR